LPYATTTLQRTSKRLTITIDLPERGELSLSGRAENLVDPREWLECTDDGDRLSLKLTVCRPLPRRGRF